MTTLWHYCEKETGHMGGVSSNQTAPQTEINQRLYLWAAESLVYRAPLDVRDLITKIERKMKISLSL